MIKKEEGITLITLIITIIVLTIIASILIGFNLKPVKNTGDKVLKSEFKMMQEAIFEQYSFLKMNNELFEIPTVNTNLVEKKLDTGRPSELEGKRIVEINTLKEKGFNNFKVAYSAETTFEQYYYLLNKEDLEKIGINTESSKIVSDYIINYSTGEIFRIKDKKYVEDKDYLINREEIVKPQSPQYNFAD